MEWLGNKNDCSGVGYNTKLEVVEALLQLGFERHTSVPNFFFLGNCSCMAIQYIGYKIFAF